MRLLQLLNTATGPVREAAALVLSRTCVGGASLHHSVAQHGLPAVLAMLETDNEAVRRAVCFLSRRCACSCVWRSRVRLPRRLAAVTRGSFEWGTRVVAHTSAPALLLIMMQIGRPRSQLLACSWYAVRIMGVAGHSTRVLLFAVWQTCGATAVCVVLWARRVRWGRRHLLRLCVCSTMSHRSKRRRRRS